MQRLFLPAATLAAVAALASACGGTARTGPPAPITIAALFSATGKGDSIGPQQANAARLAVADVDRAGGIDGARLRIDITDDRTDPAYAIDKMRAIAASDALAVLGPSLSIVALNADPVADRLRLPVLAVSNTANGLVGHCAYACQWIWRTSLGDAVAVPDAVDAYTERQHASAAAVIYTSPDALGEEEAAAAEAAFARDGVTEVRRVEIPAAATDPSAYVARALRGSPSVLFIGSSFANTIVGLIKDARTRGFGGGILAGNVLNSDTTAALAGRFGDGAQSGAAWSADNTFPANATFITRYVQRYGKRPDQFAAQAYSGVLILAQAIERAHLAGSNAPTAAQRERLQQSLHEVALQTPLGPFRFTADHDVRQIVWIRALDGHGGNHLVGFCDPGC